MGRRKRWFEKLLVYAVLEVGALMGVPIRPEDVEKMTRLWNDAVVEEAAWRDDDDSGDPPTR